VIRRGVAVCKTVGSAYVGSNPTPATRFRRSKPVTLDCVTGFSRERERLHRRPNICGSCRIGLNALASTDQPFRSGPGPAGCSGLLVAVLPGSPEDAFGEGFGRLADGSGIAGSRLAGWAGGFR
jgi:hypothetical protein